MTTQLTLADILSVPLDELRERVSLAERLAFASRMTPSGTYADSPAPVQSSPGAASAAEGGTTRTRRTKAQIDADNAAAAAATTKPGATTGGPTADQLMAAMDSQASGSSEPDPFADLGDDDMLAGMTLEAELTPVQMREKIAAIAADVVAKKDTTRLAAIREALKAAGVQKVQDIPDDKLKIAYEKFPQ